MEYIASIVAIITCVIIQRLYPSIPDQKLNRDEIFLDLVYLVIGTVIIIKCSMFVVSVIITIGNLDTWLKPLAVPIKPFYHIPELILCFIATDFVGYWYHRLFHKAGFWNFHATHHSSKTLDWLSSTRFHPIENILGIVVQFIFVVFILRFNASLYIATTFLRGMYGSFVHSNIKWSLGPLGYVFSSPYFHRWHHTMEKEGWDKNFGGVFSIWDFMFGTAYFPKNKQPHNFGVPDNLGHTLWSQFKYPFIKKS